MDSTSSEEVGVESTPNSPESPTLFIQYVEFASVSATPSTPLLLQRPARRKALDWLRGLIMIFMALDHTRLLVSKFNDNFADGLHETWYHLPKNLPIPLFLLRISTHPCAPGFFFLMGCSLYLLFENKFSAGSHLKFLRYSVVRGLILIFIGVFLSIDRLFLYGQIYNSVMWALGCCLILTGLWIAATDKLTKWVQKRKAKQSNNRQPFFSISDSPDNNENPNDEETPFIQDTDKNENTAKMSHALTFMATVFTAVLISILIQLFAIEPTQENLERQKSGSFSLFATLFLLASSTKIFMDFEVFTRYPILPWFGITLWGVAYGAINVLIFKSPNRFKNRKSSAVLTVFNLLSSVVFAILFVVIRVSGGFGNASPSLLREEGDDPLANPFLKSASTFFTTVKYPPSIAYLTFNLAVLHLLLAGFESLDGIKQRPKFLRWPIDILQAFGNSALFFYVAHFILYKLIGVTVKNLIEPTGCDYIGLLIFWFCGLVLLYFVCKKYGKFKASTSADSFWRYF